MRPPAAAAAPPPAAAVLTTGPIAGALPLPPVPQQQQFVLVPVRTAPAGVLSPNQGLVSGPGPYAGQLGLQQYQQTAAVVPDAGLVSLAQLQCQQPAAVVPDGGLVTAVQLQQQATERDLQVEVARMLSLL
jgi:hypothetical protein